MSELVYLAATPPNGRGCDCGCVTYLGSPGSQMHADYLRGMPVLLSYGATGKADWLRDYIPSFGRVLIDSGAYSEFNSGKPVDLDAYAEWAQGLPFADAVAALDDIRGDWERGFSNWQKHDWMFPTFHSSDPDEALEAILSHRPQWLGLGMVPPRDKTRWLDRTLERLEDHPSIHVHGWALRAYADRPRLNSLDSTNWFRDAWDVQTKLPWLTPAECVEIVVKRYQREGRQVQQERGAKRKRISREQMRMEL